MSSNAPQKILSPFRAALISLVLGPGAGQLYNGQKKKGYIMLAIFFAVFGYMLYQIFSIYALYSQRMSQGDASAVMDFANALWTRSDTASNSSFIAAIWLISIADAYISASMINKFNGAAHDSENERDTGDAASAVDKEDKKDA